MSDTLPSENLVIDDGSAETGRQRQLLMLGGALALLLVVGLAVYVLFLSGGDEESLGAVPSASTPQADSGATNADKADKNKKKNKKNKAAPTTVNANFTVGRNPFEPLAAEELVAPAPSADPASTDTATSTSGTAPGATAAPTPAPAPTQDTGTSYKVTLQSVNLKSNTAVINVDGKRYSVKVNDMFTNTQTGPFKLTSVGQLSSGKDSATVIFGSDAPVELLVNDQVVFTA